MVSPLPMMVRLLLDVMTGRPLPPWVVLFTAVSGERLPGLQRDGVRPAGVVGGVDVGDQIGDRRCGVAAEQVRSSSSSSAGRGRPVRFFVICWRWDMVNRFTFSSFEMLPAWETPRPRILVGQLMGAARRAGIGRYFVVVIRLRAFPPS